VTVNRTRIEQILVNLIVTRRRRDRRQARNIAIRITHADHRVIARVTDSGSGIAPENIEKVFQAFFTTKPEDKGQASACRSHARSCRATAAICACVPCSAKARPFTFDLPR